jgi:phosphorylated CTD-interacting factor 1
VRPGAHFWNFDVDPTSVCVPASTSIDHLEPAFVGPAALPIFLATLPSPMSELLRRQLLNNLRDRYERLVAATFGYKPRKESFNRWLFEQLSVPSGQIMGGALPGTTEFLLASDPILRCPDRLRESDVISRELLAQFPAQLDRTPARSPADAQARLKAVSNTIAGFRSSNADALSPADLGRVDAVIASFHSAARSIASFIPPFDTQESTHAEMRRLVDAARNDLSDLVLGAARRVCGQLAAAAEASVESMAPLLHADATLLAAAAAAHSAGDAAAGDALIPRLVARLSLSEIRLRAAPPILPSVSLTVTVPALPGALQAPTEHLSHRLEFSVCHHRKLRELYQHQCGKVDPDATYFPAALFSLLCRYDTFFGPGMYEGTAFHAAAPEAVFSLLHSRLQVHQEGFASPLNCFFRRFCSAFPDIDVYFGSRGSFFDFQFVSGSFEVGPPYTSEVMDATALKLEEALAGSAQPLSFVVFVPEWREPPSNYHLVMDKSAFLRGTFLCSPRQHFYVSGTQFRVEPTDKDRYWTCPHGTRVYVLQNAAGAEKWPVDKPFLQKLEQIMTTN